MYPADDDYNAPLLDGMVAAARGSCDIVCASRFMPGGAMVGCPLIKAVLVRAGRFHAASPGAPADHGCQQRAAAVLTAGCRPDRGRVRPGILLQHRALGEDAPARLADQRDSGAVVRAPARRKPLSGVRVAAELSALVSVRLRHHPAAAVARYGGAEGRAEIAPGDASHGRKVAQDTLATHRRGLSVDAGHRPRGRVCARRAGAGLSRGRASRLHRDRRDAAGGAHPDRAAVPAGVEGFSWGCRRAWSMTARTRRRAAEAARRTGFPARVVHRRADLSLHGPPDNRIHSFFVRPPPRTSFEPEPGMVKLVKPASSPARPQRRIRLAAARRCCWPSCMASDLAAGGPAAAARRKTKARGKPKARIAGGPRASARSADGAPPAR